MMMKNRVLPRFTAQSFCLFLLFGLTSCNGVSGIIEKEKNNDLISAEETVEPKDESKKEENESLLLEHEHVWSKENYQEPKTCSCGQTEGAPLSAAFAEYGFEFIEAGKTYPYTSACVMDRTVYSTGSVTVNDYRIVEAEEDFESKNGFEWRIIDWIMEFSDDNVHKYNVFHSSYSYDFYDGKYYPEGSGEIFTGSQHEYESEKFFVNYFGQDIECEQRIFHDGSWRDQVCIIEGTTAISVPVGYDGGVHVFMNAVYILDESGEIIDPEPSIAEAAAQAGNLYFRFL
jgi:hypothetical protein